MVEFFWNRFTGASSGPDPLEKPEQSEIKPENKITALLEGLEIAGILDINSSDELRNRITDVGRNLGKYRSEIARYESEAVKIQNELSSIDLSTDDPAKAADLIDKYHGISGKYSESRNMVAVLSEEYRLLSKLDRAVRFSKSPEFCMGRDADLYEYPRQIVNENGNELYRFLDISIFQ